MHRIAAWTMMWVPLLPAGVGMEEVTLDAAAPEEPGIWTCMHKAHGCVCMWNARWAEHVALLLHIADQRDTLAV